MSTCYKGAMAKRALKSIFLCVASFAVVSCSCDKSRAESVALAMNPPGYIVRFGDYQEIETRTGRWAGLEYSGKGEFGRISTECAIFQKRKGETKWVWQGFLGEPLPKCMDSLRRRSLAGAD